jgi:seryl-tRNA synthetase
MIDIKLVRDSPEVIKESNKKRNYPAEKVDEIINLDKEWRKIKEEIDALRARRNKVSEEINKAKKQNKDAKTLIKEAQEIPQKLQEKEYAGEELKFKRDKLLRDNPNIIDKSVPVGPPEKNKVLKEYGDTKKTLLEGHAEIMEKMDLIDVAKAASITGSRFYYLKKELVRLNHALMDFAMDFLSEKGFVLMQPPYMLKKEVLDTALTVDAFEDAIYKIEGEDLYLIGTAEHALNGYHNNEIINVSKPIRYAGISPCFRKEAGAHGRDTKGIFRVHQFEKIEQFVFCKPEDAWKEFDLILNNSIEIFRALEIPFRTIVLSSQDTGRVPTKTVDLEGWFPNQKAYRELGSCSNCLDYQSRRGNIKYQDKQELKFVFTLNNTAIATERMLCCLIENGLQPNGNIKIPKALWKYTGFKEIKTKK